MVLGLISRCSYSSGTVSDSFFSLGNEDREVLRTTLRFRRTPKQPLLCLFIHLLLAAYLLAGCSGGSSVPDDAAPATQSVRVSLNLIQARCGVPLAQLSLLR